MGALAASTYEHPDGTTEALWPVARRAADGDERAVRVLLRALGPSMTGVIRNVLGNSAADLDDVLQESTLALLEAIPRFRGECGLKHYACRIAVRAAIRARRRAGWERDRIRSHGKQEEAVRVDRSSPSADAVRRQRCEVLRQLLDRLRPEQAEALALRVVMGYSLGEVADATGVSVNTVRSRIRLGREALRMKMERNPSMRAMAREL